MNWWKPTYSVCSECQVHFEPACGIEPRWASLCPTHRKPVLERELRIKKVVLWARQNWEKLEPQALEEEKRGQAAQAQGLGSVLAAQQAQAAAAARFPLSYVRGIFG